MIKLSLLFLILCLLTISCTPKLINTIVVDTPQTQDNKQIADIVVRTITGEGPDETPTCPPVVIAEISRKDSFNPYLQGERQSAPEAFIKEVPNNHFTPFVCTYPNPIN
jgi:hypothetical protein